MIAVPGLRHPSTFARILARTRLQSTSQHHSFPRATRHQFEHVPSAPPPREHQASLRHLKIEVTYLCPYVGSRKSCESRQLSSMAYSVIPSFDLPDGCFVQLINSKQVPPYDTKRTSWCM